jgi:hypothetical protein
MSYMMLIWILFICIAVAMLDRHILKRSVYGKKETL